MVHFLSVTSLVLFLQIVLVSAEDPDGLRESRRSAMSVACIASGSREQCDIQLDQLSYSPCAQ